MTRYVALLRGINVGGSNLIKMADLKACFEDHGFEDVRTYIASGNVLFSSAVSGQARLARQIQEMLESTFDYDASVVLRSHLSRLAAMPIYKQMTARNWNTTTKLAQMVEALARTS